VLLAARRPEELDGGPFDPPDPERLDAALEDTLRRWREWSKQSRHSGVDEAGVLRSAIVLKSLSYAHNTAALRHAERVGAQDVVFVDSEGSVLEGPRSAVLIATGDGALLTPPASLPILPGTTVRAVFDEARERGLVCEERPIGAAELVAAQGVWLLSSVTLAARVHTLDGVPLRQAPRSAEVAGLVDAAILRAD